MEVLAHAAAMIIAPHAREADRRSEIESRPVPLMRTAGPLWSCSRSWTPPEDLVDDVPLDPLAHR